MKAGPWIFLNGHEAFDFEHGLAPEVEGPPGHRLSGRPPLRREADYILRRMRSILKEFGSDLPNAVRVDQFYTMGQAVHAYHLARFAEFGGYIPPSTSIIMERCFTARTNTHTSMIAVVPGQGWTIEKITLPDQAISASGYNPAVVVNDFVFVAGNQAFAASGELGPGVAIPSVRNWGGQNAFRRQVHYVIKERLEPSLKAAGSALEHSLKAQVYIRGAGNFPDFMDVWSQYFRDIPCAVTLTTAKDYSSTESMLEINLIALKNGATRRKQIVGVDIPALATYGPCVRAGELVFPSGLIAVGRDGRVAAAEHAAAFDAVSLGGQAQGAHDPLLRRSGLQGGRRLDGERRARAILPDRHPGFRRGRGGLGGPLWQAAAPVCGRAGARPAARGRRLRGRRLLDLRPRVTASAPGPRPAADLITRRVRLIAVAGQTARPARPSRPGPWSRRSRPG